MDVEKQATIGIVIVSVLTVVNSLLLCKLVFFK
jgi:hypothetical protein